MTGENDLGGKYQRENERVECTGGGGEGNERRGNVLVSIHITLHT